MRTKLLALFVLTTLSISCSGSWSLFQKEEKFPLPILAATSPSVEVPKELESATLKIVERPSSETPKLIGKNLVPVGNIHDIYLEFPNFSSGKTASTKDSSVHFKKKATIRYVVDREKLTAGRLSQEFFLFYQEYASKKWVLVPDIVWDEKTSTVTAATDHFTPFILTAAPLADPSGIPAPAACISADSANLNLQGVYDDSSVSRAKFSLIGEGFQYYLDRVYTVKTNVGAFRELGFEGALGIATCQGGGAGDCGNANLHKNSQSNEYIAFTAQQNLEVYILYDSRGGVNPSDVSADADWLQSDYSLLNGKYIYTTDTGLDPDLVPGASGYKVYKSNRVFLAGERVVLPGNKKGTASAAIQSTYWVVIKPAGTQGIPTPTSSLCSALGTPATPAVTNLKAIPGEDRIFLQWENPVDPSLKNVLIRRSQTQAPVSIGAGNSPTGTEISKESYLDTGLSANTTYYYSVFALNANGEYSGIASISVSTGTDTDGDGLSDLTELTFDLSQYFRYGSSYYSDPNLADTDGDGVSDGEEIAAGTDPVSTDRTSPTIELQRNEVLYEDKIVTSVSDVLLTEIGPPDATKYYYREFSPDSGFTEIPAAPHPFSSLWSTQKPKYVASNPDRKHRSLLAWAMDASGNVSQLAGVYFPFVAEVLDPDLVFVRDASNGEVSILGISPVDGKITVKQKLTGAYDSIGFKPAAKDYLFLSRSNTSSYFLEVWKWNSVTGLYVLASSVTGSAPVSSTSSAKTSVEVSQDGQTVYLLAGEQSSFYSKRLFSFSLNTGSNTLTQVKSTSISTTPFSPARLHLDSSARELRILEKGVQNRLALPDLTAAVQSQAVVNQLPGDVFKSWYIQDNNYVRHSEDPVFYIFGDSSDPDSGKLRFLPDKPDTLVTGTEIPLPSGYRAKSFTASGQLDLGNWNNNSYLALFTLVKTNVPGETRLLRMNLDGISREQVLVESDVHWIDLDPGNRFLYAATPSGDFLTYAIFHEQSGAPKLVLLDRTNISASFGQRLEVRYKMNQVQTEYPRSFGKIRRYNYASQEFYRLNRFYPTYDSIGFTFLTQSPTWLKCPGITPVKSYSGTATYSVSNPNVPFPGTATIPMNVSPQAAYPVFSFNAPNVPGPVRAEALLAETYPGCSTPPFAGTQYTVAYDILPVRVKKTKDQTLVVDVGPGVTTAFQPGPAQPPAPSDSVGSEFIRYEVNYAGYEPRVNFNRTYYVFWAGILAPLGNCFRSGLTLGEAQNQCAAENTWPWYFDGYEVIFNRFYYNSRYTYSQPYTSPWPM